MLLLVCFALAYGVVGAAGQVGRDVRGGVRSVRQSAWSAATARVANMRAGGPRHVGWWLWLTGATVYHSARYTIRGAQMVHRSVRTGWSAGWQRGRDRHAQHAARRATAGAKGGPVRSMRDRWSASTTDRASGPTSADHSGLADGDDERPADEAADRDHVHDPARKPDDDNPDQLRADKAPSGRATDGSAMNGAVVQLARCESCGSFADAGHACGGNDGDRHGAGAIERDATRTGVVMASVTTGEAPNIEAARDALTALRAEAEQTVVRVDQLSASLQSADLDAQTLGEVAEVLEAADVMKAAADKALSGLQARHAVMEEAVNATAHAAKTGWYRH